eukprot:2155810-Prymnesium_polylepis.1
MCGTALMRATTPGGRWQRYYVRSASHGGRAPGPGSNRVTRRRTAGVAFPGPFNRDAARGVGDGVAGNVANE